MSLIQSLKSAPATQPLPGMGEAQGVPNDEQALLDEFSTLLDKISHQISINSDFALPTSSAKKNETKDRDFETQKAAVHAPPIKQATSEKEPESDSKAFREDNPSSDNEEVVPAQNVPQEQHHVSQETQCDTDEKPAETCPQLPAAIEQTQESTSDLTEVIITDEIPLQSKAPEETVLTDIVGSDQIEENSVVQVQQVARQASELSTETTNKVPESTVEELVTGESPKTVKLPDSAQGQKEQQKSADELVFEKAPTSTESHEVPIVKTEARHPQGDPSEAALARLRQLSADDGRQEHVEVAKIVESLLSQRLAQSTNVAGNSERFVPSQAREFGRMIQGEVLRSMVETSTTIGAQKVTGALNPNAPVVAERARERGERALNDKPEQPRALSKQQELRTMEKVENALKEVAKSKDGKTLSFRLDPPQLGNVRVDVSLREGVLHARLAADNSAVNSLLRDKAQELQQILREIGLDVESITIAVRDEGGSHFTEHFDRREMHSGKKGEQLNAQELHGGVAQTTVVEGQAVDMDHWVA
ncbi:MAG: flagellar hook-length control protein FliK [Bdellovibrionales bacterium]|nr:flagellar hook-length control protein FliK [Bdellovibrionales bacterium]